MEDKVKCKICGRVGLTDNNKALRRHLRLGHNILVSKKYNRDDFFEPADSDSIIEIKAITPKAYRKERNRKWTKWNRDNCEGKNPYARIIYTPMVNG